MAQIDDFFMYENRVEGITDADYQQVQPYVEAGQSATAKLTLTPKSFEFWDAATNTMRTKPGQYEILYGSSSQDKDLKKLTVNL